MVKSLKEKIAELKSKSSLIKSKAEKGNKFALFKLGWICFDDNDVIKAKKYWTLSAKKGYGKAWHTLGIVHHNGEGSFKKDFESALKYFHESILIKTNHKLRADSFHCLASMYDNGEGTKKNIKKAVKYFDMASKFGFINSTIILGQMYFSGKLLIKRNFEKSFKYFYISAQKGDAMSQFHVGIMYGVGRGVKKNLTKSVKYLKLASKNRSIKNLWGDEKYFEKLQRTGNDYSLEAKKVLKNFGNLKVYFMNNEESQK
jgi:hypothetical protein|tara:strand:+ start:106 stop:879 length:774 start_codon:yes stop_codon:yes gene_type:complete